MYAVVSPKASENPLSNSAGEKRVKEVWEPTPTEIDAGIEFININAPMGNSKNQQLSWILKEIRKEASPIFKWPIGTVKEAAVNKMKNKSQADPETFFPMCIFDLQDVFVAKILPLIVPKLLSCGLFVLGHAGVGKTQLAKILAMAMGRYWKNKKNLEAAMPGWRRGTMMDVFRETPGQLCEAILLDDPKPSVPNLDAETLKSFLDVGEDGHGDSRYTPAKFCRNQLRCILCNDWDNDAEPQEAWAGIPEEDFMKMMEPALRGAHGDHRQAILKRAVVIIAGHRAVYIRLPSESANQPIHVFCDDAVGLDWLTPDNKSFLNAYRLGEQVRTFLFDVLA